MARLLRIGAVYRHYKNPVSRYRVLHMGLDEDTLQPIVIYQSEHTAPRVVWARKFASWYEPAVLATGEKVGRFIKIED